MYREVRMRVYSLSALTLLLHACVRIITHSMFAFIYVFFNSYKCFTENVAYYVYVLASLVVISKWHMLVKHYFVSILVWHAESRTNSALTLL